MNVRHAMCCINLAVLAWGAATPVQAELDAVQARMQQEFQLPLRWDNVEQAPQWVDGESPRQEPGTGLHTVSLEPGRFITVRVPRGEWVRVSAGDRELLASNLDLAASDGSGLFATLPSVLAADHRSLLLKPDHSAPRLVRISRPASATGAIEVAVFVSRHEMPETVAPYRRAVALDAPRVSVRRDDKAGGMPYWYLAAGVAIDVELEGPIRLALNHRVAYGPREQSLVQGYRVRAELDKLPWRWLEFQTAAEHSVAIEIDGRLAVVGRQESAYLEIPQGKHRLTLTPSTGLYVRLVEQETDDYLFPGLNAPALDAAEARQQVEALRLRTATRLGARRSAYGQAEEARDQPLSLTPSLWLALPRNPAHHRELPLDDAERLAQRLIRDNTHAEGGLLGAMVMDEMAGQRRDIAEVRQLANEWLGYNSFFRDLLPRDKPPGVAASFAWFLPRRLQDADRLGLGMTAARQHRGALLERIGGGWFLTLPASAGAGAADLRYPLPPRATPSTLRIAVARDDLAGGAFQVGFDDAPPLSLELADAAPGEQFAPAPGDAALALVGAGFGTGTADTLHGPFGGEKWPAALIPVATFELPLPAGVREIRIGAANTPLRLALQYRAAKPFALNETDHLALSAPPAEGNYALFERALAGTPPASPAEEELTNHWQPLLRLLRAQEAQLGAATRALPSHAGPRQSTEHTAARLEKARNAAALGQWMEALELYAELANGSAGEGLEQALLGRAEALLQLGEVYLAEQQLRSLALWETSPRLREAAVGRLERMYREQDDEEALLALRGAMLAAHPSSARLAALAASLAANGEAELALMAGSILPAAQQPLDVLLRAAYHADWRETLRRLARQLPADDEHLWLGLLAQRDGDEALALDHMRAAGGRGRPWLDALERGRALRSQLAQREAGDPVAALAGWGVWQDTHPGPVTWREEAGWIGDFAGTETLYSIDRNLYARHFRADPGRPLKLRVAGPVRLRFEARPLHLAGSTTPLDGWLRVTEGGSPRIAPINANSPASGLRMVGRDDLLPGRKARADFSFGPGIHELEAGSNDFPLLLRVLAARPETPLAALPILTPETAAAHVFPRQAVPPDSAGRRPSLRIVPPAGDDPALQGEVTLRTMVGQPVPPSSRQLAAIASWLGTPAPTATDWPEGALLAEGRIAEALTATAGHGAELALRRMTLLAWLGEHVPAEREYALAHGEAIAAAHPDHAAIQALNARIGRDAVWRPISGLATSAGLRYIEVPSWQPESPAARIRKALTRPAAAGEHIVAGNNRLVLSMNNLRPARLVLTLFAEDPPALPPEAVSAKVQLDDGEETRIDLAVNGPGTPHSLTVPGGAHVVRVRLLNPLANQMLRVRFEEGHGAPPWPTTERPYHVATRNEPLRLAVAGPAWLRIDEWRGGTLRSEYRLVEKEWEEIVLAPASGAEEALLRLHRRAYSPQANPPPLRRPAVSPVALAAPLIRLDEPRPTHTLTLEDAFPLGRQEDGTWSWQASLQRRRGVAEDQATPGDERFLELRADYRYFDQDRRTYFKTTALARKRDDGGPTFGLGTLADHGFLASPLRLRLEASILAQRPESRAGQQENTEWSALGGAALYQYREIGAKTMHLPSVGVFARALSMDGLEGYRRSSVDQDIFTDYKHWHRHGIQVADSLYHRPWLDTQWYGGFSLVSNEDWNLLKPDHLALRAGWKQLLGDVQANIEYRHTRYFADANRADALARRQIGGTLAWDHWTRGQDLFATGLTIDRDLGLGDTSFGLYLSWQQSGGRMYRDYRPVEVDFLDLKRRRIPQHRNNSIVEDGHAD